jgi:hypothetical protein
MKHIYIGQGIIQNWPHYLERDRNGWFLHLLPVNIQSQVKTTNISKMQFEYLKRIVTMEIVTMEIQQT